jgi:serine/threonine protein kinase
MLSINDPPKIVIIKISRMAALQKYWGSAAEDPIQEILAMQYLHPNAFPDYPLQDTMYQFECCVTNGFRDFYSIMPYCKLGDVMDLIMVNGALNNSTAKNMMKQLLDGLEFLQSHGIGHRDMSLENVVMDVMPNTSNYFKFVITDFGMAVKSPPRTHVFDDGDSPLTAASHQRIPHKDVGKLPYNAPEIFLGAPFVNPMLSDMWALGIMLLAALTGHHPFEALIEKTMKEFFNAG